MVNMSVDNDNPKSWGDVRIVILGDSHIGNLSFRDIPVEERPKLRARSYKGAQLHRLLPMVDTEITKYKPDIVVLSVGQSDLTHLGSQYFPDADHQHHVRKINHDFDINMAATEIFDYWHNWLSKYNCKVLFALTYPMDLQEINNRRLEKCTECQEHYSGEEFREVLWEKIQDWGNLLKEKDVPVMHLDDVLERMNPSYKETDAAIEENERALVDGLRPNGKFGQCFYTVIREVCEQIWPDFLNSKVSEESVSQNEETAHEEDVSNYQRTTPSEEHEENGNDPGLSVPPKKKLKIRF